MKNRQWLTAVIVLGGVSLLAAACGSSDSDSDGSEELPRVEDVLDDVPDDDVAVEPACALGEPLCDDTTVVPDEGIDLPEPDGDPVNATDGETVSGGMTVDGGLTVSAALASDATTTLAVKGYGFVDESGSFLCESLASGAERYECGGAYVQVKHLDLASTGATVVPHDGLSYTDEERRRNREFGALDSLLHTDMHEVIGHASGQINPGVGTPKETLKTYSSTLEEARSDLVALYFIMDQKLIDLDLVPSLEVGMTSYDGYIRNGLQLQLRRVEMGNDIEQAHMRNRQLVAAWVYEKGQPDNVIEKIVENGKTYFVVRDYAALRVLFGELLAEIQRIKSEGDYDAAQDLVETYGVKVDRAMHEEVLARIAPLNIAAFAGFIQPRLVPVEEGGEIIDVKIEYPEDFPGQMLELEENYSFLPVDN